MKKIAVIVKTDELSRDDRVRKEIDGLKKKYNITVFVVYDDNRRHSTELDDDVEVKVISLKSRKILKSGKYEIIKSAEWYWIISKSLKNYELVWCHDMSTILFVLLLRSTKIVWDLHELPVSRSTYLWKFLLYVAEKKSLFVVHANQNRVKFLQTLGLFKKEEKQRVLRNYPDKKFVESSLSDDKVDRVKKWLCDDEYVYMQGLSSKHRFPYNSIAAVLDNTDLKIVVVGRVENDELNRLKKIYGDVLIDRVNFVGLLEQLLTPSLIREAKFSLVLYTVKTPNNRYCEPNRLFHAVSLGVPVIVGYNDPMRDLIVTYGVGVVIESDGECLDQLGKGIDDLNKNYKAYKENALRYAENILWDENEDKKGLFRDVCEAIN